MKVMVLWQSTSRGDIADIWPLEDNTNGQMGRASRTKISRQMKYNCKLGLWPAEKTHLIEQFVGFYTGTTEYTFHSRCLLCSCSKTLKRGYDELSHLKVDRQEFICLHDGEISELLLVSSWHPLALWHKRSGLFVNLGLSSGDLVLQKISIPTSLLANRKERYVRRWARQTAGHSRCSPKSFASSLTRPQRDPWSPRRTW